MNLFSQHMRGKKQNQRQQQVGQLQNMHLGWLPIPCWQTKMTNFYLAYLSFNRLMHYPHGESSPLLISVHIMRVAIHG